MTQIACDDENASSISIETVVPMVLGSNSTSALMYSFCGFPSHQQHIAVALGAHARPDPLIRIHSQCLTGDVFGSQRCDCGPQLAEAIEAVTFHGGYILYLMQEGRGIGLNAKLAAYEVQDRGFDTFAANQQLGFGEDDRDFGVAVEMLRALDVKCCRLLTNNPEKVSFIKGAGIDVLSVQATSTFKTKTNLKYLDAKIRKKKHTLDIS